MSEPRVSVILCHHLNENDAYLRLTIESLAYSKGVVFETLLLSSAPRKPQFLPLAHFSLLHDPELDNTFKKLEVGLTFAKPETTHYLFLSDDVIVSEYCIKQLYQSAQLAIVNPMSNGDQGTRYHADLKTDQLGQLFPDMTIEDFSESQLHAIKKFPEGRSILIQQPWVSFFCTLIPKEVWTKLRGLDPKLEWRHNDQDFCMRAAKIGVPSLINLGAFAFHFGSRTLRHVKAETKQECTDHFLKKWGSTA